MGSISFSKHHIVVLMAAAALSLLVGMSKGQTQEEVQVTIKNSLNDPLTIICHSKDGAETPLQVVPPSGSYEFRFMISEKTLTKLYRCNFDWRLNSHQYMIYYQPRELCAICQWYITAAGPCQILPVIGVQCHKWDGSST